MFAGGDIYSGNILLYLLSSSKMHKGELHVSYD